MKFIHSLRLLVLLVTSMVFFSGFDIPGKADFSGRWKLNESRTEAGKNIKLPEYINVAQTGTTLSVMHIYNSGEVNNETLGFDEPLIQVAAKGSIQTTRLKWSDEGSLLTIDKTTSNDKDRSLAGSNTQSWSLENEGKTLLVRELLVTAEGESNARAYYDKQ